VHKKILNNFFLINTLVLCVGFLVHINSFAADLIQATNNTTTEVTSNDISAANDALSEIALTNLESIELETDPTTMATSTTGAQTNSASAQVNLPSEKKADHSKNPAAILASLAFNGKGANGIRNYADAAEQFCQAARNTNDADAEYALGWMYQNGKGVAKDENLAVMFYSMAAKQFHQKARDSLSASAGNPNIAKLPECMTRPPAKLVAHASTSAEGYFNDQALSTPFYVKGSIYKLVSKIAPRFNIDTDLAMAFIAVESGFNPKATSPKNAQGLMQLIPATASRFNVKNAYDPEQNIKGGLAYLQWLLTYFEGDITLVAAAYNAGENTVDRYKGVPPYPETRKYVKKIASLYKKSHHPFRDDLGTSKKSSINKVSG
jgi:soluble lytic murein transglycosylase-like protein